MVMKLLISFLFTCVCSNINKEKSRKLLKRNVENQKNYQRLKKIKIDTLYLLSKNWSYSGDG
jgi:hypothetical protein